MVTTRARCSGCHRREKTTVGGVLQWHAGRARKRCTGVGLPPVADDAPPPVLFDAAGMPVDMVMRIPAGKRAQVRERVVALYATRPIREVAAEVGYSYSTVRKLLAEAGQPRRTWHVPERTRG